VSDAPIDPQEYLYGPKVVTIEDIRVARGLTRRPMSSCRHKQLVYDDKERRIWCQDCESQVESFDAFVQLCGVFQSAKSDIDRRRERLAEAESFQIRSRAAKVMDDVWRSKNMAPLCPHCHSAIMPEDVVKGIARASKSLIIASRKREDAKK
jgi:Zn finger protein HypA/HybF involved in hydrogenase expression